MTKEDTPKPAVLPEPDTHCWDDDDKADVWSYSRELVLATIAAAVAAERERIRMALRAMDSDAELHNYYGHAAWVLFERPNVADKRHGTVLRDGSA